MGLTRNVASAMSFGAIDWCSDKQRIARYTKQTRNATRKASRRAAKVAAEPPPVVADELAKLARLHDSGALSDEEFEAQKKLLLGR
jgi:Short C-terminal domain